MQRPSSTRADLALVQRVTSGDREAIETFLERMRCVPRMLASRNQRLGSPIDASELEDLAQETLIAVWRKLSTYNGSAPLEAWVYRFVHLEMLYRLRQRGRRPALLGEAPVDTPAPSEETVLEDESALIYGIVETVGPPEADIIRWKHFDGLTFREISDRLSMELGTVKSRYYRGLSKLRERLAKHAPDSGKLEP